MGKTRKRQRMEDNGNTLEDSLLDKYLERYDPETPNDELMLRQMAKIEAQIAVNDERIDNMLDNPDQFKHTELESAFRNKDRLVKQHQNIQNDLGISKKARAEREDVKKELPRIIQGAQEFLHENATFIYCPHCEEEAAHVKIRLGYIFHFRQDVPFYWCNVCPRCGGLVELHDNWPDDIPLVELPKELDTAPT
jgi:hypothetical protein